MSDERVRTRPRRLTGMTARAAVLAMVAGGCGLPTDDQPVVLDEGQVAFGLTRELNTAAPTFSDDAALAPVELYLVDPETNTLVVSTRQIETPVNLDTVVGNLMAGGVAPLEDALGLANLVPDGELRSIDPGTTDAGRGATIIEVRPDFFDRLGVSVSQRLAIGQVVLTAVTAGAMGGDPIQRIQFKTGDTIEGVPDGEGAFNLTVSCEDYVALLAPGQNAPCG